ncbi:hypothetical protein BJ742DRAFT_664297, partial [Cladochytrium replicatum]
RVTDLASRMFGNYTLTVAVIRIICAYHLSDVQVADVDYVGRILYIGDFVYKTAPVISPGVWPALIISS